MLTANWRDEIKEFWGIHVLSQVSTPPVENTLWTTRCSKIKNGIDRGTPKELYVSTVNKYFYRCMEDRGLLYGVLSDKYGLHVCNEKLPYYDVHPSDLSQCEKQQLGRLIRKKALTRGFGAMIFYNPSPLMSVPYFEMLHYSGLDVLYTTRLNLEFEWG